MKRYIFALLNIFFAMLLGLFLLVLSFLLPVERIDGHVKESVPTIQEEGGYPILYTWCSSKLDNYTDSLILLESMNDSDDSVIERSLRVSHGCINNVNYHSDVLVYHYVDDVPFDRIALYSRYWHGYLIIVKPLLMFVTYPTLRIINGIFQAVLFALTSFSLIRKGKKQYLVPWILGYLMLMPIALSKCIEFSPCYYIFMIAVLLIIWMKPSQRYEYAPFVFLNTGIALAYFDYLTYPIATLGVTEAVYLIMTNESSLKKRLFEMIDHALFWGLGYAGMWISKWIIATMITGENVIESGIDTFLFRTSSESMVVGESYGIINIIITNALFFLKTPVTLFVVIAVLHLLLKCLRHFSLSCFIYHMIPFFLVGILPAAWYAFALNHSAIHYWFTNKACVVSVVSMMFGLTAYIENMEGNP